MGIFDVDPYRNYAVKVVRKSNRNPLYETNLSEKKLKTYITEPYNNGDEFYIKGNKVEYNDVDELGIRQYSLPDVGVFDSAKELFDKGIPVEREFLLPKKKKMTLKETRPPDEKLDKNPGATLVLERLSSRFEAASRQLLIRHNNKPTINIEDEYDVQDLFHALLRLFFDDIRKEVVTPRYAGGASRVDFGLDKERILVETKMTRSNLKEKELGDELIIDIERYRQNTHYKILFCFIYDPEKHLRNPAELERDLSKTHQNLDVIVKVFPKA